MHQHPVVATAATETHDKQTKHEKDGKQQFINVDMLAKLVYHSDVNALVFQSILVLDVVFLPAFSLFRFLYVVRSIDRSLLYIWISFI